MSGVNDYSDNPRQRREPTELVSPPCTFQNRHKKQSRGNQRKYSAELEVGVGVSAPNRRHPQSAPKHVSGPAGDPEAEESRRKAGNEERIENQDDKGGRAFNEGHREETRVRNEGHRVLCQRRLVARKSRHK